MTGRVPVELPRFQMRAHGIPSPDRADAAEMAFHARP